MATLIIAAMALTGCASEVTVKDGQTYYGNSKVHYTGSLEAIKLYDKNHQEHLLTKGEDGRLRLGSEKANDLSQVADENESFHSFSHLPVVDALALVFFSLAASQKKGDKPVIPPEIRGSRK